MVEHNRVVTATTSTPSLDFNHVSREILSLVARRRELMVFLGSLFAALSIFLNNLLHGGLPPALAAIERHAFLTYAIMLLIPTVLIALRIMRLHGGMTINGILYSYIMAVNGDKTTDPLKASRLNWSGISTGLFLLAVLDVVLAAMLLALALKSGLVTAIVVGSGCGLVILGLFLRNHQQVCHFAFEYIRHVVVEPMDTAVVEDHQAQSLQDANQDMLGITTFVGLILFSVMENLTGLGGATQYHGDIAASDVLKFGPPVYATLTLATASMGTLIYRRLMVAAGNIARKLDPSDDPFKPWRITDTALGYIMLCFLFGIALHFTSFSLFGDSLVSWEVELFLNVLMVMLYPLRVWRARQAIAKLK